MSSSFAVDGLTGFPQAIEAAFPKAIVQTCIVASPTSLRYVSWGDRKRLVTDLRTVYGADTEEAALGALEAFDERWRTKYPMVHQTLAFPMVRGGSVPRLSEGDSKILYTTNIIESLNAQLRKVLRPKGHFPNDDAVLKILFLAIQRAKLHWKQPIHWKKALAHFAILSKPNACLSVNYTENLTLPLGSVKKMVVPTPG